jgi:O-acetyl-ADP-ribose deacetylase (regulator of RNase III)
MEWTSKSGRKLRLETGDITRIATDAIVNAANSALAGGGGVDGAIHRAGGPEIMQELDRIRPQIGGRCPTGGAVATAAGRLPARYVFHAVGPVYRGGRQGEAEHLASCYRTCLKLAEERKLARLTFPAISTGIYGYPMNEAARIALREVMAHLDRHDTPVSEAVFVLFDRSSYDVFAAELTVFMTGD